MGTDVAIHDAPVGTDVAIHEDTVMEIEFDTDVDSDVIADSDKDDSWCQSVYLVIHASKVIYNKFSRTRDMYGRNPGHSAMLWHVILVPAYNTLTW